VQKLIHPCQNTLIRGRYISDGVMLVQEVPWESKFKKKQGMVFKIDFKKAYDKLNWNFLLYCCRQKKVQWQMACVDQWSSDKGDPQC
jgi:hypothetical protein